MVPPPPRARLFPYTTLFRSARVDTQAAAHDRELVGQRDVDVPEHVLIELGELRDLRAGDLDYPAYDLPVEERRHLAAGPGDSTDHLGDLPDRKALGSDPGDP